ncbi:alkaline phosphatase [Pseudoalteromonas sp. SSM20]|uniref:alkaline phosphatase n=1 Tax=Pseudoalteromonas sp. SSM20 TaxID=3139394 RepID=UPI003BAD9CBE
MKKSLIASAVLFSSTAIANVEAPKNIIYMIGDGMGPAYTAGYRYYMDDPSTKVVEKTIFDELFVGMARTSPDDDTVVTDSAAGATALSTATKSYNGAIAVDTHKKPLTTMLQIAKSKGLTTALVATSQINHATPASFAAHNEYRRNYNEIADDYIDVKVNGKLAVDLLLGGGYKYFIREDRDLVSEFKQAGYHYESDYDKLHTINSLPAIGLFKETAFAYAIDQYPTRLSDMAEQTFSLLDKNKENGFFVMLEGSQIDWCGHANDIACAMAEMDDFANAIKKAKQYVDSNPETLLVVTADHSTGGLTLGANGDYSWHTNVIKGVKASGSKIAKALMKSDNLLATWQDKTAITLDKDQAELLVNKVMTAKNEKSSETSAKEQLVEHVKMLISKASNTGWTTSGHTAIDVPILAYGKGADEFRGHLDNTEIASKLINFIKQ